MPDRDYTDEIALRRKDIRGHRDEIIRALDQGLPEAVVAACIVDSVVRESAPLEVRLQFALAINQEVQQIAAEWGGKGS